MRALLLVVLAGCGTVPLQFIPDAELRPDLRQFSDAPAVVLFRSEHFDLDADGRESWTDIVTHEVTAVQTEGGFDAADVRLFGWGDSKLTDFRARIVQPDGTYQTFTRADVRADPGRGENALSGWTFRFPNVRVGSVLEVHSRIRRRFWIGGTERPGLSPYPMRHYEFRLRGAKPLTFATIEFSGLSPIDVHSLSDGTHELTFTLRDVPPRPPEPYAPHASFLGPAWAFRLMKIDRTPYLETWEDIVASMASRFDTSAFPLTPDLAGCDDWRCKVERVLGPLRRTRTDGVDWDRSQPLAQAMASGRMSSLERALATKKTLERLGAEVELVFSSGRLNRQFSRGFPRASQFDRALVRLPVQRGNPTELVVDPSCDACEVGELPEPWSGANAFAFDWVTVIDRTTARGTWFSLPPGPVSRRALTLTHRVSVQADGSLDDVEAMTTSGEFAQFDALHHANEPHWLSNTEWNWLRRSTPVGTLEASEWGDCTARTCTRRMHARLPAEARHENDRWLVATSFLRPMWEDTFERPDRVLDVHFPEGERLEETADVIAPEGFVLERLPAPRTQAVGELRVTLRFEALPNGVRLIRTLDCPVSTVARADYLALRDALELWREARRQLLVFKKVTR